VSKVSVLQTDNSSCIVFFKVENNAIDYR